MGLLNIRFALFVAKNVKCKIYTFYSHQRMFYNMTYVAIKLKIIN